MQAIINGEMHEIEPAVKVILDRLMIENAELKKAISALNAENSELFRELYAERMDGGADNETD